MKPTIEILENIQKNSSKNKDEVFTRLFRYMLRPDLYYIAYKNLYANNGAATEGVNSDTADGFSEKKVNNIIRKLKNGSYQPNPVKRIYIKKKNGKKRPLGLPTFTDKLVQEALCMILEAVYEPIFLDCSHGFRKNKSCHTALKDLKHQFHGTRWFIEGDIKGCFDTIDHKVLLELINRKIKDKRLIELIQKFLKAGYMENWQYNKTYSGCPQGGICSPIFANIYLHELDKFVRETAEKFEKPSERYRTKEYRKIEYQINKMRKKLKDIEEEKREEKQRLIQQIKSMRKELLKTPCKSQTDKKIKYIRYCDDFIIGVNGSKEDCKEIKKQLSDFITQSLKMELSEEKTLITHSSKKARFLGYDIRVRRNNHTIKREKGRNCTKRTLNNMTELTIPFQDKIMKFMFDKKIIYQKNGVIKPLHRAALFNCTELEIVATYNAELRGICNYYSMASNFCNLNYFSYLMEYSCLKTLANKHKCTIGKIKNKYKDGKGKWCIPYQTKTKSKQCYFASYQECKKEKNEKINDMISNHAARYMGSSNCLEKRLKAKKCELCGAEDADSYEIHHIHKLKDLKGKRLWEKTMIAKQRKTLVVCHQCHKQIHKANG